MITVENFSIVFGGYILISLVGWKWGAVERFLTITFEKTFEDK